MFCKIVAGKIPADIVYRDDSVVAFKDVNPQAPVHLLVVPGQHIERLTSSGASDGKMLSQIFSTITRLAQEQGLDNGFRVVANCGEDGGQTVPHLHFHVLGKRRLHWPPG